jgi:uncharacterized repeat protein (TIGR01451 family)
MLMFSAVLICSPDSTMGGVIDYTYDAADRLVAADYGAGRSTTYSRDLNGNLLNRTTSMGTNADVRLTKDASVTAASAGLVFKYTLTVVNDGPDAANGVVVTDPLPFGILFSSATAEQGSVNLQDRTVVAEVGVLPAGGSAAITVNVFHGIHHSPGNAVTNTAMVAADQLDSNLANNTDSDDTRGLDPPDNDGDEMPNWWETLNGPSPFSSSGNNGADGDFDGDGVRNFDEWIADTPANDANIFFRIGQAVYEAGPGEFTVSFSSSAIREYALEFTQDLSQPFVPVQTVPGTGLEITLSHDSGAAGGYYRVDVRIPSL